MFVPEEKNPNKAKVKKSRYGPYTEEVIEHFRNPKNMGAMDDADAVAKVGSPICGDELWLYIKVDKNENGELYIKDVKFQSFGCAAAVATGSMITELAKGKTLKDALKISRHNVSGALGGLPKIKVHCSLLSSDALHEAIYNYCKKNGIAVPSELEKLHEKIQKGTAIARLKQESEEDYCDLPESGEPEKSEKSEESD
jgi:nitrogen fixation NifU-like protein